MINLFTKYKYVSFNCIAIAWLNVFAYIYILVFGENNTVECYVNNAKVIEKHLGKYGENYYDLSE